MNSLSVPPPPFGTILFLVLVLVLLLLLDPRCTPPPALQTTVAWLYSLCTGPWWRKAEEDNVYHDILVFWQTPASKTKLSRLYYIVETWLFNTLDPSCFISERLVCSSSASFHLPSNWIAKEFLEALPIGTLSLAGITIVRSLSLTVAEKSHQQCCIRAGYPIKNPEQLGKREKCWSLGSHNCNRKSDSHCWLQWTINCSSAFPTCGFLEIRSAGSYQSLVLYTQLPPSVILDCPSNPSVDCFCGSLPEIPSIKPFVFENQIFYSGNWTGSGLAS